MITVKVTPDGSDAYDVTATSRDVLTWEKTSRGKSFMDFMSNVNMVDLYRIAHIASLRQQLFTGSLQDFEKTCEVTFSEEDQEPEPDPTQPAP